MIIGLKSFQVMTVRSSKIWRPVGHVGKRKKKRRRNKIAATRNLNALKAWNISGAGCHGDKKKENDKNSCRQRYTSDDG